MAEYIEREALLTTYKKWLPQLVSDEDKGDRRGVETCIAVLEDAPAADVEPVKHGKWIEKDLFSMYHKMHNCSECGEPVYDNGKPFNFCPNCGARMDGE